MTKDTHCSIVWDGTELGQPEEPHKLGKWGSKNGVNAHHEIQGKFRNHKLDINTVKWMTHF
jgi:hypothetical protein